ncbi:MAG TPA: fatty acyl-AMP ligase, partial [Blastocatellia bacterium]|nr:fatty acyl-AMP ligase [Blastocatellia bacterium]
MKGESNSSQTLKQEARFGFETLVEMLRLRAEKQPDFAGWIFLEDGETETSRLTYRSLYERACAVAATLQERGVRPGERALLTYRPGIDFVSGFFGCLLAGVIAVPAYPPNRSQANRGLSRLLNIIADAQPAAVLSTADVLRLAEKVLGQHQDLSAMEWLATDGLDVTAAADWRAPRIKSEDLAFLQYTSGSTGAPRGVMLKHSNLLHNAWMVYESFKEDEKDVYLSWLPIFHDMGFMAGILQPLYANLLVVLMPPGAFLQRPLRWLIAIGKYRATISGGPNFAFDLCARRATSEERAQLDLSNWRIAFNGAEPVRAETLDRFARTFAESGFRREALYPCYGLAEATLIVSGGRPGAPPAVHTLDADALHHNQIREVLADVENAKEVVGCGHVLMDQKVVIANPESLTRCAASEVGEIWVA